MTVTTARTISPTNCRRFQFLPNLRSTTGLYRTASHNGRPRSQTAWCGPPTRRSTRCENRLQGTAHNRTHSGSHGALGIVRTADVREPETPEGRRGDGRDRDAEDHQQAATPRTASRTARPCRSGRARHSRAPGSTPHRPSARQSRRPRRRSCSAHSRRATARKAAAWAGSRSGRVD